MAIAVVIENTQATGGEVAAPLAAAVMQDGAGAAGPAVTGRDRAPVVVS